MKALSKLNIAILLSCIVLTACNSGGSNTTPVSGNNGGGNTPTPPVTYQETVLYSFAGETDGAYPVAGLIQASDGNLYGTTYSGSVSGKGNGTVFKITSSGVKITLYSFAGGKDGAYPAAVLVQGSDGNFYGTTEQGGKTKSGTVFKITSSGVKTTLYSFAGGKNGATPYAGLIQDSNGNFYGTTANGDSGTGTVFTITSSGVQKKLYNFKGGTTGAFPQAGLIQASDGNFYGTTTFGGRTGCSFDNGCGTVFKITSSGVKPIKTTLYRFAGKTDGANPYAGLVQGSDGSFYGTTKNGGLYGSGTVFKITSSVVKTTLYNFESGPDGANPWAALIIGRDGNFYGTTANGGGKGYGTVFKITPQGAETVLYRFNGGTDGANPIAGLVQVSDGSFYGTTINGGGAGVGTLFKISIKQ